MPVFGHSQHLSFALCLKTILTLFFCGTNWYQFQPETGVSVVGAGTRFSSAPVATLWQTVQTGALFA